MKARVDRLAADPQSTAFSRPLRVDEIPDDGLDLEIVADPSECAAIARQTGVPAVAALSTRLRIERRPAGGVNVNGDVAAKVTQVCVVSLEPFEKEVEQPVEVRFAPVRVKPPDRVGRARQSAISRRRLAEAPEPPTPPAPDEDDPPDPIVDGCIDLGSVAVEFLILGLDFYPKKPGVQFAETVVGETDAPKHSAFAALERLKGRS